MGLLGEELEPPRQLTPAWAVGSLHADMLVGRAPECAQAPLCVTSGTVEHRQGFTLSPCLSLVPGGCGSFVPPSPYPLLLTKDLPPKERSSVRRLLPTFRLQLLGDATLALHAALYHSVLSTWMPSLCHAQIPCHGLRPSPAHTARPLLPRCGCKLTLNLPSGLETQASSYREMIELNV